jgi:hypothetical protein
MLAVRAGQTRIDACNLVVLAIPLLTVPVLKGALTDDHRERNGDPTQVLWALGIQVANTFEIMVKLPASKFSHLRVGVVGIETNR